MKSLTARRLSRLPACVGKFIAVAGLLCICSWTSCRHAQPSGSAEDASSAIIALLNEQAAAWSSGNIEDFCDAYAEDATFIAPSGLAQGRQQILDRYKKKYTTPQEMGTLQFDIVETRVTPEQDGAAVILKWALNYPDKKPSTGLALVVLRRIDDAWKIVQDASM